MWVLGNGVVEKMLVNGSRRVRLGHFALCAMLALSLAACGGGAGTQPDALSSAPVDTPSNSAPTTPPANNIPLLEGEPSQTATVGAPYTFVPSASDPDQDPLTFEVTGLPK